MIGVRRLFAAVALPLACSPAMATDTFQVDQLPPADFPIGATDVLLINRNIQASTPNCALLVGGCWKTRSIAVQSLLSSSDNLWSGHNTFNGKIKLTGPRSTGDASGMTTASGAPLDSFRQIVDADDTAALSRAAAACVPVLLGPKSYAINNYSFSGTGGCDNFTVHGVKGKSVIQRTTSAGASFMSILAKTVDVDGVTFDFNAPTVATPKWGLLLSRGGQNVSITNSAFKNLTNAAGACVALVSTGPAAGGSFTFKGNDISACAGHGALFGSVSNGVIRNNNFHDNPSFTLDILSWGTASRTNFSKDVVVSENRFTNNVRGVRAGAWNAPYAANQIPAAAYITFRDNTFTEIGGYNLALNGDRMTATGNKFTRPSGMSSTGGAMNCVTTNSTISNNTVDYTGVRWGLDCGGSIDTLVSGNHISMDSGTLINFGAAVGSTAEENYLEVNGSPVAATGIMIPSSDDDGAGNGFPFATSGIVVQHNHITVNATTATGVRIPDNAGGLAGTLPIRVVNNDFTLGAGVSSYYAIKWAGKENSVVIDGNTIDGTNSYNLGPNGSGDVVLSNVFLGGTISGTNSKTVRAFVTNDQSNYSDNSIWAAWPTSGGSGYHYATTTVTASGGCTWIGSVEVYAGVIQGVRTLTPGTNCYGATITVSDSDATPGTGAVIAVMNEPEVPLNSYINYYARFPQLLQAAGAPTKNSARAMIFTPTIPLQLSAGSLVRLQRRFTGAHWQASQPSPSSFAVGSLPTCNSAALGAQIIVTGGASGKRGPARCDGTNWKYGDGRSGRSKADGRLKRRSSRGGNRTI
jgi:hypothetical protein